MNLAAENQYLGVDWGEKRIGLALAEPETKMALPFKTVNSLKDLLSVIIEEEIALIIIGVPIKMAGEAANNPLFLNFLQELKAKTSVPVVEIDERLSSKAADALIGDRRDKAGRDEIAASIFLQTYLDRI
ncbi:MAG: Holliday junction resolvase RuvX [Patescibacteria group bacterium]|nr:Holliday junction resolvase RuvX [Patescibacteria group bacterium]